MNKLTLQDYIKIVDDYYGEQNNHYLNYTYGPWVIIEGEYPIPPIPAHLNTGPSRLKQWQDFHRPSATRFFQGDNIEFIVYDDRIEMSHGMFTLNHAVDPTPEQVIENLNPIEHLRRQYYIARLLSPFTRDVEKIQRRYNWARYRHNWRHAWQQHVLARIPLIFVRDYNTVIKIVRWWYGKSWMIEVLRDGGCYKTTGNILKDEIVVFNTRGYKLTFDLDVYSRTMTYDRSHTSDNTRDETFIMQLTWFRLFYELWYLRRLPV